MVRIISIILDVTLLLYLWLLSYVEVFLCLSHSYFLHASKSEQNSVSIQVFRNRGIFLWVTKALCLDALELFAVCSVVDLEWQVILQWCFLDRYVILGGHRDSWVFGGIDPQSGAAVVHEIVRSFGTLKKEGNINKVKKINLSESQCSPLWSV